MKNCNTQQNCIFYTFPYSLRGTWKCAWGERQDLLVLLAENVIWFRLEQKLELEPNSNVILNTCVTNLISFWCVRQLIEYNNWIWAWPTWHNYKRQQKSDQIWMMQMDLGERGSQRNKTNFKPANYRLSSSCEAHTVSHSKVVYGWVERKLHFLMLTDAQMHRHTGTRPQHRYRRTL